MHKVVVIGAGLGGLSAAARLAAQGFDVTVVEQNAHPGGKAASRQIGAYRFDTGPSLLTMAHAFDQLFAECGEERAARLEFARLDPICNYFFADGSRFSATSNLEALSRKFTLEFGESPGSLEAYLKKSRQIYDTVGGLFLERSLHKASTYLNPKGVVGMMKMPFLGLGTTMHHLHTRYFRNPKTIQLFDRLATYNGSDPYQLPGTLAIIAHVEYSQGAYAVPGGIVRIPQEMAALAERHGARFLYNTKAEKIVVESGRVKGVATTSGAVDADLVVCNADPAIAYEKLLATPDDKLYRRYRSLEPSSSGIVFYWGIGTQFPELDVNNIFFSTDYSADFRAIFGELRCPDDPTVYVNITSKVDASDARPGGENWFVLVNAPRDSGQEWKAETSRMRSAAIRKISAALGRHIEPVIEAEDVMTPPDIEAAYGSPHGSLYGISSNSRLAAFLRHPNWQPRVNGLFFCGGSGHPGGGMPLAVLSGKIAAAMAARYAGRASG